MNKLLYQVMIFLLVVFLRAFAFADDTITGSYCFTYGDRESLQVAKEITRTLAIRNAIESYRVFIETSTTVNNFTLTNDILQMLSSGTLKNITVEKHTEKGRTICESVKATVSPIEFEKVMKQETLKRNKKSEEIGLGSNGCLEILSVDSTIKNETFDERSKAIKGNYAGAAYGADTHVTIKALENSNKGTCLEENKAIVFVDYFDIFGKTVSGDRKDFSGSLLKKGEIKEFSFYTSSQWIGSFRVWLEGE